MEEREARGGTAELLNQPEAGATRDEEPGAVRTADSRLPQGPGERQRDDVPLLEEDRASAFRERWEACQRSFVDEPRDTVQKADELVADVMRHLAETFAAERTMLERQWTQGEDVSTEDLRLALQRYRSFFNRLLAV